MKYNDNSNYYIHTVHCGNCGEVNLLQIPKGTRVSDYLRYHDCQNCGIKLKPDYYDKPYRWNEPMMEARNGT